tara:strand:- start:432 stop:677 length:246 start_codon:yes stop_codon:yes gene_type:complete
MSVFNNNKDTFAVILSAVALLVAIVAFVVNNNGDTVVNSTGNETAKTVEAVTTIDENDIEEVVVVGDPEADIEEEIENNEP